MDFEKYIRDQLDAGVPIDKLLNSIADTANKVIADEARNSEKVKRAQEVINVFLDFVADYYPDLLTEEDLNIKGKDLIKMLDNFGEIQKSIDTIVNTAKQSVKKIDADKVIADFLKDLGL